MRFRRFVAIGDSQTEGLWDGDDGSGLRGWADRLAERLAVDDPGIEYANLAVRSRRIAEIHDEQFAAALAMEPDLVGVCVGMNDATALTTDMGPALDLMDAMYRRLAETGATVLTTTFPNIREIIPAARFFAGRVEALNARIRRAADEYGLHLVDLYSAPSMVDLRMWSPDRLHGSALGHERFALAAAEALGLEGADDAWTHPLPGAVPTSGSARLLADIDWVAVVLGPWVLRRLRGVSTGDGRTAKRPQPLPFGQASPSPLDSGA
ncbi:SGNH/GDSL hydrolase family protein [Tsukamurella sp. 8F]|uniref:SGNH/GDSL hydrolase family protein n=1 Tax=unclassified Tsukamurella TaxID=2633480 RepID=UPI0023B95833|nr:MULTISPECIES: SGNH/GDSL hydrolase family protein [unclassified Tsukamurella]MDF0530347.1 SGNH/GDSL hydrolase family protein [Tsukamurella sp. 8J]MDF0587644.1 SGNH/GDSL hydrolase family protein [Tsukamurella sp. 8F]